MYLLIVDNLANPDLFQRRSITEYQRDVGFDFAHDVGHGGRETE